MRQRNYIIYILLTIATCGFFALYWMIQLTRDANRLAEPESPVSGLTVLILEIITCGFYIYFWSWNMGKWLSAARVKAGLKPRDRKGLFLVWMFFCYPVSFALMQNDVNDIQEGFGGLSETENKTKDAKPESSEKERGALFAGLIGAGIFLAALALLEPVYSSRTSGMAYSVISVLAPLFNRVFSINIFKILYITAGLSSFLMIPFFLVTRGSVPGKIAGCIGAAAMAVMGAALILDGIFFVQFFTIYAGGGHDLMLIVNRILAAALLTAGAGHCVFCGCEFRAYRRTFPVYAGLMAAACGFMGLVSAYNLVMSVLTVDDYQIYGVARYLPLWGRGVLLIIISRLLVAGCDLDNKNH